MSLVALLRVRFKLPHVLSNRDIGWYTNVLTGSLPFGSVVVSFELGVVLLGIGSDVQSSPFCGAFELLRSELTEASKFSFVALRWRLELPTDLGGEQEGVGPPLYLFSTLFPVRP